jgi:hypothetical protein
MTKLKTAKNGRPYKMTSKGPRFVSDRAARAAGWKPRAKSSARKRSSSSRTRTRTRRARR